jgi:hypothetical protein
MERNVIVVTSSRLWASARAVVWVALCSWSGTALAHDTTTSWTIVRLRPSELDLTIKIAAEAVWPAVQVEAPGATLAMEQLDALRPMLVEFAKRMHTLSMGDKPLRGLRGDVRVVEDYLEFHVVYAPPAKGLLQFKANYLSALSPEFTAEVSILDASDELLVERALIADDPAFEITLPDKAVPRPKPKARH